MSLPRGPKVTRQTPLELPPLLNSLVARPGPRLCLPPPLQRPSDSLLAVNWRLYVPVLVDSPGPVVTMTHEIIPFRFSIVPSTTCLTLSASPRV